MPHTTAKGKKRHMLTLTSENVKRFQDTCKEIGLPNSTLSNVIDDMLRDLNKVVDKARANGGYTIRDMFNMIGEQMELLQEEERKNEPKARKEVSGAQEDARH